jgi:transketolase
LTQIDATTRLSADIRIQTIRALEHAGFGHIGGSMSIADVLAVLYGGELRIRPQEPDWPERDYLVLSKGHCGPALYAALALKGYFPMDWLNTVNQPGTRLPSHCDRLKTPGIDMTTGSLGQGISSAAGIALGLECRAMDSRVFCILGDGELQEGQVWEAAAATAEHLKLNRLIAFVDENKRQLDGYVADVCGGDPIEKFRAFGWNAMRACGWDLNAISREIRAASEQTSAPSVIVLETTERESAVALPNASWQINYMVISKEMADEAVAEIERRLLAGVYPAGEDA